MKLWIVRHGEAEAHAASDSARALTAHGQQQAAAVGDFLQAAPTIDQVLVSPYRRAQQTCAAILASSGLTVEAQTVTWLTPDGSVAEVIRQLEALQGESQVWEVMLVSHQPLVSQLISWLVEGHGQGRYPMAPASVTCIEGDFVAPGLMRVQQVRHAD